MFPSWNYQTKRKTDIYNKNERTRCHYNAHLKEQAIYFEWSEPIIESFKRWSYLTFFLQSLYLFLSCEIDQSGEPDIQTHVVPALVTRFSVCSNEPVDVNRRTWIRSTMPTSCNNSKFGGYSNETIGQTDSIQIQLHRHDVFVMS